MSTLPGSRSGAQLHGREAEIDVVRRAATRLASGLGSVIVWLGEPGIGKSALLRAAAEEITATAEDLLVVQVSGRGVRGGPFEVIRLVIGQLLPSAPQSASNAPDGVLRASSDRDGEPRGPLRATAALLREVSKRRPVLVSIDDGGLIEHGMWAELSTLAAQIAPARAIVMVAEREGSGAQLPQLSIGPLTARRLEGLATGASLSVVQSFTKAVVPRWVAADLAHQLAGNPAALRDAARVLSRDELRGYAPLPDPLPASQSTVEKYRPWLESLEPSHRTLVLCAALHLRPDLAILESVAGLEISEVVGLGNAPWARVSNGRVEFVDARLRSAVIAACSYREINSAHAALATAFVADREAQLLHRLELGDGLDGESVEALAAGADDALDTHDYVKALLLAKHALAHCPRGERRAALALTAGIAAYHEGHLGTAATFLHEAVADAVSPATRFEATLALSLSVAIRDGSAPIALIDRALDELSRAGQPAKAASLACLAGRMAYDDRRFDVARAYLRRAEALTLSVSATDLDPRTGFSPSRLKHELDLTRLWVLEMRPQPSLASEHLSIVTTDWPARDLISWELAARHASLLVQVADWQQATFAVAELEDRQGRLGSRVLAAQAAAVGLDLAISQGAIRDAAALVSAVGDHRPLELAFGGVGLCLTARTLILRDSVAEAEEWLTYARQLDRSPGYAAIHARISVDLALLEYVQGDFRDAARLLAVAVQRLSNEDHHGIARLHLELLEARQAAGLKTGAEGVLPLLEQAWGADGTTPADRALLAAARLLATPKERVLGAALAAVDAAEWQASPVWAGRVRMMAARALGQLSPTEHSDQAGKVALSDVPTDRDEHRRSLVEDAHRYFEESGATALARLATETLAGLFPEAPASAHGSERRAARLTPDEQRVAELVASGASNRQVASTTYVSVRTVELRLTSVYRKLGIRSRKELADALTSGSSEHPGPATAHGGSSR